MEALSKFKRVNLFVVIIKHLHKVMTSKDGKHGFAYGFWLNRVFAYFGIQYGPGKDGPVK